MPPSTASRYSRPGRPADRAPGRAVLAKIATSPPFASNPRCDPWQALQSIAFSRSYGTGQEIYGSGDPAQDWHRVTQGAARKCLILSNGRRRIVDFLLPGDFFGFGVRNAHHFSVEAIAQPTVVQSYPRGRFEALAECDGATARAVREMAFEALARAQASALILGRVTAPEKVLSFLLEMADRSGEGDRAHVALPMSRYDIADYLAISVETVSRALSHLKRQGAIRFETTRRIKIAVLQ